VTADFIAFPPDDETSWPVVMLKPKPKKVPVLTEKQLARRRKAIETAAKEMPLQPNYSHTPGHARTPQDESP
jgi:hypothetical protein